MKRFRLWLLLLPVLLGALTWGLKWRADNYPTPTKLDLEIRALMLRSSAMEIVHSSGLPSESEIASEFPTYRTRLSPSELKPFAETFALSPERDRRSFELSENGLLSFSCSSKNDKGNTESVLVEIYLDMLMTRVVHQSNSSGAEYDLHPVVAKGWLELLLNHPRIGPELRRRMKQ